MKTKHSILIGGLIAILTSAMPIIASANTDTDSKFNVIYQQNQYQNPNQPSWTDLKLEPGQQTTVDVTILNRANIASDFTLTPSQATTNSNMVYSLDVNLNKTRTQIQKNQYFSKIITLDHTKITVPAKSKVTIPIHISMPNTYLSGNWFGGVKISKTTINKNDVGMTNNFAYNQVIMLSNNGTMEKPDLKLNSLKYHINKISSNYLQFNLTNFAQGYMSHASTEVQIYTKSGTKIGSIIKSDNHSITNGNTFNYNVPLIKNLKPGTYVADFKIIDKTNDKIWYWKPEFKVSGVQFVTKSSSNLWWLFIIILILLALLLLWFILYRNSEIVRVEMLNDGQPFEKDIKYREYKKLVKNNIPVKLIKRHIK